MLRMNFPDRREQRRNEAVIRQEEYDALHLASKMARCVRRPGDSKKELVRLRLNLNET